jgi:hypothetical protein
MEGLKRYKHDILKTSATDYDTFLRENRKHVNLHTDDSSKIEAEIRITSAVWKGDLCPSLSLSIGYASHRDYPDATVEDLKQMADSKMYEDKNRFYRESGLDRRSHK